MSVHDFLAHFFIKMVVLFDFSDFLCIPDTDLLPIICAAVVF